MLRKCEAVAKSTIFRPLQLQRYDPNPPIEAQLNFDPMIRQDRHSIAMNYF